VAEPAFNWRPTIKRRVLVVAATFVLWTIAVEARLVFLQIFSYDELTARADNQSQRTTTLPAKRGEIVDRQGRILAYSVDADTIYAVPYDIDSAEKTAAALCAALDDCSRKEQQSLASRLNANRPFTYVRRRVTPLEARKVAALKLNGIGFMKESRRFYPNKELAAHLLGYVGLDNVGLSGLEAAYDKVIRGKEGKLIAQTDARRQAFGGRLEKAPTAGGSLELTIDEQLQYIVERELRAGVEENRADGGAAVLLDPRTGEILAIASWPTFNPNAYNAASELARRNRAVQDIYEPGSTFKVVTIAAALEEDVMPVDTIIDTNPGTIRFGHRVIDEFGGKNLGALSLTDVIVRSSNVGAVKIGLRLGAERFGVYASRFGFGKPTSPDFPSESPGILWSPAKLNDGGIASMSMGYQVGVTPLQMAAAMNVVANGGTWIEPRIVRAMTRDGVRTKIEPRVSRRVISPETALEMLPILEKVVTDGTASLAFKEFAGYTVAGKTGTADKLVNGRYVGSMQNVSFLGFIPSRNPVLTGIVMIDTPRVANDTGGGVAAPIFKRIAEAAMRQMGVPPNINAPTAVLAGRREGPEFTRQSSLRERVTRRAAATQSAPDAVQVPAIVTVPAGAGQVPVVPDLRGRSAREALRTLAQLGLTARVHGRGVVIEQTPAPGTPLERGITCELTLDRDTSRIAGAAGEQP
jgi:cell division protein FtsI/penicillin-binding protein 2